MISTIAFTDVYMPEERASALVYDSLKKIIIITCVYIAPSPSFLTQQTF